MAEFFAEKNTHGDAIDHHAAVAGRLQLVPDNGSLAKLAADYHHMVDDGLFLDYAEPSEALMERCQEIQRRANAIRLPNKIQPTNKWKFSTERAVQNCGATSLVVLELALAGQPYATGQADSRAGEVIKSSIWTVCSARNAGQTGP